MQWDRGSAAQDPLCHLLAVTMQCSQPHHPPFIWIKTRLLLWVIDVTISDFLALFIWQRQTGRARHCELLG